MRRRPGAKIGRGLILAAMGVLVLFLAGAVGWLIRAIGDSRHEHQTAAATVSDPGSGSTIEPSSVPSQPARPAVARRVPRSEPSLPEVDRPEVDRPERAGKYDDAQPPVSENSVTPETTPPTEIAAAPVAAPVNGSSPPAKAQTLFQEIDIQRAPKFTVLGTVVGQDLQYQMLSELRVAESDEDGFRTVEQVVQDTRLIKSDELSRAMFAESLQKLKGWQFTYKLNRRGEVVELVAGPADGRAAAPVAPPGGKGFLVTSVMDQDGWKEMAQLSFLAPDEQTAGEPWIRQMTHNYGPLGSWYGETRFVRKGTVNGLLRIDFTHHLTYKPPEKDSGELPFAIKDATFNPEVAGGTIYFDTQAGRVQSAQERFLVRGTISTELLGEASSVQIEEQQAITVRILDQNPWVQQ